MHKFQSHNGAIAAGGVTSALRKMPEFQSHNGAIAATNRQRQPERTRQFQSHNGAIAARGKLHKSQLTLVSIPQWCDCCSALQEGCALI